MVDLCHHRCHEYGPKAAHQNEQTMDELHRYGQKTAMEKFGWDIADFIREFGRNYLDGEPEEAPVANTFQILEEEICGNW